MNEAAPSICASGRPWPMGVTACVCEGVSGLNVAVYARNAKLLVKLGDHVYKGDVIAQVGQLGSRVIEYFEVRRGGQAMNPLYYLP